MTRRFIVLWLALAVGGTAVAETPAPPDSTAAPEPKRRRPVASAPT
jgi:hypothetical protein